RIIVPAQRDVAVPIAWSRKTENEREHQSRSAQCGRQKRECNNFENGNPLLLPGYIFDAVDEGRSN
ncbi:MAG: hypothetical protein OQK08_06215, partial [Marinobacter sp.]|nr:hypothetical protein [Marinobacter sp.]